MKRFIHILTGLLLVSNLFADQVIRVSEPFDEPRFYNEQIHLYSPDSKTSRLARSANTGYEWAAYSPLETSSWGPIGFLYSDNSPHSRNSMGFINGTESAGSYAYCLFDSEASPGIKDSLTNLTSVMVSFSDIGGGDLVGLMIRDASNQWYYSDALFGIYAASGQISFQIEGMTWMKVVDSTSVKLNAHQDIENGHGDIRTGAVTETPDLTYVTGGGVLLHEGVLSDKGLRISAIEWIGTAPEGTPYDPVPANDGTIHTLETTLHWSVNSVEGVHFDVWFGTEETSLDKVADSIPVKEFLVDSLVDLNTYYWRVDAIDPAGKVMRGGPWSFNVQWKDPMVLFFEDMRTKDLQSDTSIRWIQFGPGMSGNNKAAHWHPTDPDILFIGPNMGNSYRTTDRGFTYQTIYNEDALGLKSGDRGPREINSVDFSRQDPDHGFCTGELPYGIWESSDRGATWQKQQSSRSTFGDAVLACVAVDPKDDNTWYVGAGCMRDMGRIYFNLAQPHGTYAHEPSQNKIWKSTDDGKSWVLKNTGLHPKTEVETIVVDPVLPGVVYASTNYGFYKSLDGGENWVRKSTGLDNDVLRSFTMHHNRENDSLTMYVINSVMWKDAGTTVADSLGGIFRSNDRGETWTRVNGNLALDMRQWEGNIDIEKSYYHTVGFYFGITDDAAKARFPDMPSSITQRFNQITVDPNDPDNIYVVNKYSNADENNFKPGQMYRSKDGGQNWYVTFRNGKNWNSGADIQYWTDRGNPLGTNITMRYLHQWVNRDAYDRKSCNFTRFNADGTVLHAQMAKVAFMSYDKGDTWVDIDDVETTPGTSSYVGAGSSNVPGHGFYQHLQVQGKVFCSAGENSLWVTNDEGEKVREGAQGATSHRLLPDETSLSCYAIHPHDTTIHYALFFRQAKKGKLMRSVDNGRTWTEQGTPIPHWDVVPNAGDQSIHQLNLIIDADDPGNMYFHVPRSTSNMEYVGNSVSAFGIHRSTDGGKTWSEPNNGLPESLDVAAITFDPDNYNILYAAVQNKNGGLFRSEERGESWSEVTSTASVAGTWGINDIHFARDGKVYITSGFKNANDGEGGLWVSADSMRTWRKIFDYPWVNRVETALYDPQIILISTLPNNKVGLKNPGTFLSKDGGETWIKFNLGNGQSDRINDIAIENYKPGKYYASTYGSGWYVAVDPDASDIVSASSIIISDSSVSIFEGETFDLDASVTPSEATFVDYIWTTSDPSVATVSQKGVVTGISAGNATVTVKHIHSGITGQTSVEVKVIAVTGVYLEPDSITLILGSDTILKATVEPENAADKRLQWTSSDTMVVEVSESGLIETVGAGVAEVVVSSVGYGFSDVVVVSVVDTTSTGFILPIHLGELKIYPNPVKDEVTISGMKGDLLNAAISLYDLSGRKVLSVSPADLSTASSGFRISLGELDPGTYVVEVISTGLKYRVLLIKQ